MEQKLLAFEENCPLSLTGQFFIDKSKVTFRYSLSGELDQLETPKEHSNQRVIGLWEKTCFEAFILNKESNHYLEFNFSTNGDWNVFRFEKYRGELKEEFFVSSPAITFSNETLEVIFEKSALPDEFLIKDVCKLQLTAILKTKNNKKFHFAPAHPLDGPDFHQFLGFEFMIS